MEIQALVVPLICESLSSQPIAECRDYEHLADLNLADFANASDSLEVDLLIGSDLYWNLVTGRVRRGKDGPLAVHTKVGWVLSGPVEQEASSASLTLCTTSTPKIDTLSANDNLDDTLRRFWDLDALGITRDESSVYDKFTQRISFTGTRYQVCLPWKDDHPPLSSNYDLSLKRLNGLLKHLRQNEGLLAEYHAIIQDQLCRGIVELVDNPTYSGETIHFLPHHAVIRQDKTTSKLRIVYDASAKENGVSLNDCLYTGPSFGQSILDILLRFRIHRVALAGDIEKAFLMVGIKPADRDYLRFLWLQNY